MIRITVIEIVIIGSSAAMIRIIVIEIVRIWNSAAMIRIIVVLESDLDQDPAV